MTKQPLMLLSYQMFTGKYYILRKGIFNKIVPITHTIVFVISLN